MRLMTFDEVKGYATRENAIKKLQKEVPEDSNVTVTVVVNSSGRFVPVAIGEKAVHLGLFFRGICVTN